MLRCFLRGHDEWTVRYLNGWLFAPPCYSCGRPNSELRWRHHYTEVSEREPTSAEDRAARVVGRKP